MFSQSIFYALRYHPSSASLPVAIPPLLLPVLLLLLVLAMPETCTICRCISSMSRCHGNRPPASLGFLKSPAHGAFKLKEAAWTAAGSLRTGRWWPWWPSRRACYADCRQPATASGPPYHHPSGHIKDSTVYSDATYKENMQDDGT